MRINGEKTYLRAIESNDNEMLFELINDPDTEKLVGGSSWPVSTEEQETWQKKQIGRKDTLRSIIVETETDNPVGTIIISDIDQKNGVAQVHIKLLSKFRGKGFGSDALNAIVKFVFFELRMNCIYAEILAYNASSVRLFEKCGFSREGVLRERIYKNGCYCDVYIYSILNRDVEKKCIGK